MKKDRAAAGRFSLRALEALHIHGLADDWPGILRTSRTCPGHLA